MLLYNVIMGDMEYSKTPSLDNVYMLVDLSEGPGQVSILQGWKQVGGRDENCPHFPAVIR